MSNIFISTQIQSINTHKTTKSINKQSLPSISNTKVQPIFKETKNGKILELEVRIEITFVAKIDEDRWESVVWHLRVIIQVKLSLSEGFGGDMSWFWKGNLWKHEVKGCLKWEETINKKFESMQLHRVNTCGYIEDSLYMAIYALEHVLRPQGIFANVVI